MNVIKSSEEQLSIIEESRIQISNGENFTDDQINSDRKNIFDKRRKFTKRS